MRAHGGAVAGRYRGKLPCWDVVPAAVADTGDTLLRSRGAAQRADPDAQLFHNDYNATNRAKRGKLHRPVKDLRGQGVAVAGLGPQGHWRLDSPPAEDIRARCASTPPAACAGR